MAGGEEEGGCWKECELTGPAMAIQENQTSRRACLSWGQMQSRASVLWCGGMIAH